MLANKREDDDGSDDDAAVAAPVVDGLDTSELASLRLLVYSFELFGRNGET